MLGTMTKNVPLDELGEFLKKRRSELSPHTVGLPDSISTGYYTRLEPRSSSSRCRTRARVSSTGGCLFQLAGKTTPRARRRRRQQVQAQL